MPELDLGRFLFHGGFQNHSSWRPGDVIKVERSLKYQALFFESILVADSDLNNHDLMPQLFGEPASPGIFAEAVRSGFVRRAVRATPDGAPESQQRLFEAYRRNSPERASKVPDGHPARLDRLFERQESIQLCGLYQLRSLATIFAHRILFNLQRLRAAPGISASCLRHAARIERYVRDLGNAGHIEDLRGASIEKELAPPHKEQDPHWKRVWAEVLDAYTGNLPEAFDSKLVTANPVPADANPLPAGPEAPAQDQLLASEWFLTSLPERQRTRTERVEHGCPLFEVDANALYEMDLRDVIALREKVGPHPFFTLRHEFLGARDPDPGKLSALVQTLDAYLQEINAAYSRVVRLRDKREALWGTWRYAVQGEGSGEREVMVSAFTPGLGENTRLFRAGESALGSGGPDGCNYLRPNYEIFHRMADADWKREPYPQAPSPRPEPVEIGLRGALTSAIRSYLDGLVVGYERGSTKTAPAELIFRVKRPEYVELSVALEEGLLSPSGRTSLPAHAALVRLLEMDPPAMFYLEGDFGTGKSTLLQHFAWERARALLGGEEGAIPVRIALADLPRELCRGTEAEVLDAIEAHLRGSLHRLLVASTGLHEQQRVVLAQDLLRGRVLWLLDGLDELVGALREGELATFLRVMLDRKAFRGETRVLAGRPLVLDRYGRDRLPTRRVAFAQIQKLTDAQIDLFVQRRDSPTLGEALQQLRRGLGDIRQRLYDLQELSRTPVVLAILCSLEQDLARRLTDGLPIELPWVYERFLRRYLEYESNRDTPFVFQSDALRRRLIELVAIHMAEQVQETIDLDSELVKGEFLNDLRRNPPDGLSEGDRQLLLAGREDAWFSIRRELTEHCMLQPRGGGAFSFAHRSFAEYVQASWILRTTGEQPAPIFHERRLDLGVVRFLSMMIEPGSVLESRLIGWIQEHRWTGDAKEIETAGYIGGNALSILLARFSERALLHRPLDMAHTVLRGASFFGLGWTQLSQVSMRKAYMVESDAPADIFVNNEIKPPKSKGAEHQVRSVEALGGRLFLALGNGHVVHTGQGMVSQRLSQEPSFQDLGLELDDYLRSFASFEAPEGRYLAFNDYSTVHLVLLDLSDSKKISHWLIDDGLDGEVHRIAMRPTGQGSLALAYGCPGADKQRLVRETSLELATGRISRRETSHSHGSTVNVVRYSPDGTLLASAADDGVVLLSRLGADAPPIRHQLETDTMGINEIAFSPDGEWIAAVDGGGQIALWSTRRGGALQELVATRDQSLFTIDWKPIIGDSTRSYLVAGGVGKSIHLLTLEHTRGGISLASHQHLASAHPGTVRCVRIQAAELFSVSVDGTLKRWALVEGELPTIQKESRIKRALAFDALHRKYPYDFFLSYPSGERALALELEKRLSTSGAVFIDRKSLALSTDWSDELVSAIRNSRVFVALLSSASRGAHYQRMEIQEALELYRVERVQIAPVLSEGENDDLMRDLNIGQINAFPLRSETDMARVVDELRTLVCSTPGDLGT